MRSSATNPG